MNTHKDIVNKRKCVHIYNNMEQTADNINEYRYGYAIESYNNINMESKDVNGEPEIVLETPLQSTNSGNYSQLYQDNLNFNEHKDLKMFGNDDTKDIYDGGSKFWRNPNKDELKENKNISTDSTKSTFEAGKEFWENRPLISPKKED